MALGASADVVSHSSKKNNCLDTQPKKRTVLEGQVVRSLVDVDGVLPGHDIVERRSLLGGLVMSVLLGDTHRSFVLEALRETERLLPLLLLASRPEPSRAAAVSAMSRRVASRRPSVEG